MSRDSNQVRHAAPGSTAGFIYQFGRALWWLATQQGYFEVGIETLDDVVLVDADGTSVSEQDKYSIQDEGQPVSDRSVALWKTLGIWADLLTKHGESFRFVLVTNRPVPESSLIAGISRADSDEDVDRVLEQLLKVANDPSDTLEPHCKKVQSFEPELLRKVLRLTSLSSSQEWDSIREESLSSLRLPSSLLGHSSAILNELLGWITDISMQAWRSGKQATITSQAFSNALDRAKEQRRRQNKRERPPAQIPITPTDLAGIVQDLFVEQLKLVDVGDETVQEAIHDFIRYGKEVIRLTQTGEFTPRDWKDFEQELQIRWKRIFERIQRLYADKDEKERGIRTYYDTTSEFMARLKGEATDHAYFTSGAYHRLADELDVGWHPRFIKLLTGKDDE